MAWITLWIPSIDVAARCCVLALPLKGAQNTTLWYRYRVRAHHTCSKYYSILFTDRLQLDQYSTGSE